MDPVNESPRVLGNRYEVGDLLGRGGMAEVHLGRDTRLGRTVAIKLLRTDLARDPTFQARFRREAQSAAALNHPAIVAVYDTSEETVTDVAGTTVSLPYIVMEYVQGRTLRDLIEAARDRATAGLPEGSPAPDGAGALDIAQALEVTSGVLSALEYSHRAGIVHRDIKPANVMLTANGDVKVMDFGIARAMADAGATMTQTQAVIGTAQYLSPEQARGETVDARSDLYSTGCLLFELLTGRPPFVGDAPVAVAYQHVREFPQPPSVFNPLVPEDVDRIVMHALTKDRDIRYQSAAEFREDVDAARRGTGVGAPAVGALVADDVATEYLPADAATTRAIPAAGAGMLPGAPGDPDAFDYHRAYETGYQTGSFEAQRDRRNRGWIWAIVGLALLAVAGIVGFILFQPEDGPRQVQVPPVAGQTQQQATDTLTTALFRVDAQTEPSDTVAEGNVIRSNPEASEVVPEGSTVTIYVSTGPTAVTVPGGLVGMTQQEAREALEAADLTVGDVNPRDADVAAVEANGIPEPNTVVDTEPGSGESLAPGSAVNLFVASGDVVVPNVTGGSRADAEEVLGETLQLDVRVREEETADADPGTVIRQSIAENDTASPGDAVTIVVAIAPAEPTPPPTTTPPPTATEPPPTDSPTTPPPTTSEPPPNP